MMHTLDNANSNVPAFLMKLWKLVEDSDCDDLISWSENGNSFIIRNYAKFAKELLPRYFKHNNMASFIRQLNMYGFKKLANYESGGLNKDNDEMAFHHAFFQKKQQPLLELIKRKMAPPKATEAANPSSNPKDILTDLTSIREKQESMDTKLTKMKNENELLWRELSSMRQKHKAQEQIIQKVIQFLVSIVQGNKQNIGLKRSISRMIHDSSSPDAKKSCLSRQLDVVRGKQSDFFITVPPDKLTSPQGPVIHEVTEFDHEDSVDISSAAGLTSAADRVHSPSLSYEGSMDSNLNSPMNSSGTLEPLSLLEPLQSRIPVSSPDSEPSEEQVLGLPLDYSNVISIPEGTPIILPELDFPIGSPGDMTNKQIPGDSLNKQDGVARPTTVSCLSSAYSIMGLQNEGDAAKKEASSSKIGVKNNLSAKDILLGDRVIKSEARANNLQLALSDATSSSENAITKTAFTNHILNVEEELDWLHNHLTEDSLNIDASTLLNLFSNDDVANNSALVSELASDDHGLRETDNNIIGNELVQFTPSMLEIGLDDMENQTFLDCFDVNIVNHDLGGATAADLQGNCILPEDNTFENIQKDIKPKLTSLLCPDTNFKPNVKSSAEKTSKSKRGKSKQKSKSNVKK